MKRRQALQNIAIITAGVALLPACNFETLPVYENVALGPGQRSLIDELTNTILPKVNTAVTTQESTTDFILTILNDCHSPEDIQKYLTGITEFQELIKTQQNTTFGKLDIPKRVELLTKLREEPEPPEATHYFLTTTYDMTSWHFTSSAYYMKNYKDFEFIPGRYVGCSPV